MNINFPENIEQFLHEPHYMTLGTLKKDGSIQMSVVWYKYENGVFKVSTTSGRAKYNNISRDPRVTFVIFDSKNPYSYVQVQGQATMDRKKAHEFIDELSQIYTGKAPYQWDPDHKEDRVIIEIKPQSHVSFGF